MPSQRSTQPVAVSILFATTASTETLSGTILGATCCLGEQTEVAHPKPYWYLFGLQDPTPGTCALDAAGCAASPAPGSQSPQSAGRSSRPRAAGPEEKRQTVSPRRSVLHPAAVRCDMVFHQAFCARRVRNNGIGGEVRHGVISGVSRETSSNQTCNLSNISPPQGVRVKLASTE